MDAAAVRAPYYYKGSIRFLRIVRTFVSIFADDSMPYLESVRRAGLVTTYLRLWRGWVVNTPGQTLLTNFITREGMQDAILACHMVVFLIKLGRDYLPDTNVAFDWLGTDVCEDFFSSLGSFSVNKRTYSVLEAIETACSKIRLQELEAGGYVKMP
jgi:hypothetical protein